MEIEQVVQEWSKGFIKHRYKLVVNYTRRVFEFAFKEEIIRVNPFGKVHIPTIKEGPKRTPKFYDRDKLNGFLNACLDYGDNGEFWHTFFHFLAFTGLRKGEALALEWSDMNFEAGYVEVGKTLATVMGKDGVRVLTQHDMTKNGENRVVSLDELTISNGLSN